jgi:flagellar motor switch protein FliN
VASTQDILRLEVPIIVNIGSRMLPLNEVLKLSTGSIIELAKGADEELELNVNNKTLATGIAVKVGENFGIQISYIGDIQARLDALASQAQDKLSENQSNEAESQTIDADSLADDVLNQIAESAGGTDQDTSATTPTADEEQAA